MDYSGFNSLKGLKERIFREIWDYSKWEDIPFSNPCAFEPKSFEIKICYRI